MSQKLILDKIEAIINNSHGFGLELYVCVRKEEKTIIKKFLITDNLMDQLKTKVKETISKNYLGREVEDILDVADNKKVLYDVPRNEMYDPFSFLNTSTDISDQYDAKDKESMTGFVFRINFNNQQFWGYQQLYPMSMINKSKNIYAIIGKNKVYDVIDKDFIAISGRIDMLILKGHILTDKTDLLQNKFGFDKVIRNEAEQIVEEIINLDLLSNPQKLKSFSKKEKLTNAKKIMKAKNSPIIKMDKTELISRINKHHRYREMVRIENGKIITETEKEIKAFIKLINDDLVKSELSDVEYDSPSKKVLDLLVAAK